LNNKQPLIKGILPKMALFGCRGLRLFFWYWGQCHLLCQATQFADCPAIVARVMCGAHVTAAVCFLLLLVLDGVVCVLGCAD
jgi:hypothetical protein